MEDVGEDDARFDAMLKENNTQAVKTILRQYQLS